MWSVWLIACTSTPDTGSGETGAPSDSGEVVDSGADTDSNTDTDSDTDTDVEPELLDWSVPGTESTAGRSETVTTATGCTTEVQLFGPEPGVAPVTVLLSHGFARSSANMVDLGAHLASWGVAVAVPALCHSSLFDTDHAQNGADLVALADELGATKVVYAGQSAGGLASVIAASNDAEAVGVIGLDPVDTDALGATAAATLTVPLDVLKGAPSECNASGNATSIASAAPSARVLSLPGATHCTFEFPTSVGCTLLCSGDPEPEVQRAVIRMLVTASVLEHAGINTSAGQRWSSTDAWLAGHISSGVVQP